MKRFLQLHYLTVYPPSNPNRDDQGRPKTAHYGGVARLRISSQALKRAARQSDVFQDKLNGHLGQRTQRIGEVIVAHLKEAGADEEKATEIAKQVTDAFGKLDAEVEKKQGVVRTRQLAFISPDERKMALDLAERVLKGEGLPEAKDLSKAVLRKADGAADIAMFGRMLADDPDFNRDAAVQVAHAITTHRAVVEDDYYTAVDDLKRPAEDAGAGFVGDAGFGSGVFYLYVCVNRALLLDNLDGDASLAKAATEALVEALATASPPGKRNSFANFARAGFVLAERGDQQPRSLASAFLRPVDGADLMQSSIGALKDMAVRMDDAYGSCADARSEMNLVAGDGTLGELVAFSSADLG